MHCFGLFLRALKTEATALVFHVAERALIASPRPLSMLYLIRIILRNCHVLVAKNYPCISRGVVDQRSTFIVRFYLSSSLSVGWTVVQLYWQFIPCSGGSIPSTPAHQTPYPLPTRPFHQLEQSLARSRWSRLTHSLPIPPSVLLPSQPTS